MSKQNDGGPAFPGGLTQDPDFERTFQHPMHAGISVRDYFAIHCDQPGEAEIATAAGFVLSDGKIWETAETSLGSFTVWYKNLPQQKRFELYAKVRYALADAMLAERVK